MTEEMVREVFGLGCRIVEDPVAGTPMCIPLGRKLKIGQEAALKGDRFSP
jgi:iron complex transport system ATP-binding protein